jgi:hypothetical protein
MITKQSIATIRHLALRSYASVIASLHDIASMIVGFVMASTVRVEAPTKTPASVQQTTTTAPPRPIFAIAASTFNLTHPASDVIHLGCFCFSTPPPPPFPELTIDRS